MISLKRKLLLWSGCLTGILLVLAAIGVGFFYRYINSEPAQKKIRQAVTGHLGGYATYSHAYLTVFPRPGLAFSRVVITIPQTNKISVSSVNVYPELLPLWTGELRPAKLKFESPDITIDIPEKSVSEKQAGPSSLEQMVADVDAVIGKVRSAVPGLVVVLRKGKLLVREAGSDTITMRDVSARIAPVPRGIEISFQGNAGHWGHMSARGKFYKEGNDILIKNLSASVFDSSFTASAVISGAARDINSANVAISGNIGQETVRWVSKLLNLPPEHTLRAPLSLSNTHLVWQAPSALALSGIAVIENGPTFSFDLRKYADVVAIKRLIVRDEDSHAAITLTYGKNLADFSFKGNLTEKALNRAYERTSFHYGWMKGDFSAHVRLDRPGESLAQGYLEGAHLIVPLGGNEPLKISHAIVRGDRRALKVDSATVSLGENHFILKGVVKASDSRFRLDMDVSSDGVNVEKFQQALADRKKQAKPPPEKLFGKSPGRNPVLQGIVRLKARSFNWGRYTTGPVTADIFFDQKGVSAVITDASLCGIAVPGNLRFDDELIRVNLKPQVTAAQLDPVLDCLLGKDSQITGIVDMKAEISARGKPDALLPALQGKVDVQARNGRIYKFPLLSRILVFLNLTELLRGKIPDLDADGLGYNSILIKGDIRNGKFVLSEAVIDGTTMQLAGQGEIDIPQNRINLTVLVAPFKTVDYLVSKIPLVNYVLRNTLISIPLRITGKLDDPKIVILSPTAVGKSLLGIMTRTIMLPVRIIEPVLPRSKEKEQ